MSQIKSAIAFSLSASTVAINMSALQSAFPLTHAGPPCCLSSRKSSSEARSAAKQREVGTWIGFSFVEGHNDHTGEDSAKLVERGSWFMQLISTASDGIQILPGLEMQCSNGIQDVTAVFPSAALAN